jgi:hypothetical protein
MLAKNSEFQKNKENRTSNIKSKKRHHKKNYFNSSSKKYQIEEKEISSPQKVLYNPKHKESPEHEDEYKGLMYQYPIINSQNYDNTFHYNEKEKSEEYNNFKTKWKTEICRNWEMYGECKYGNYCAFAHGDSELKTRKLRFNYKTKACKQFFELGYCSYGIRCQFSHKKEDFIREKNKINGIKCDENKISYWKIIKEFLSDENNNISHELVKRPRLKTFENITSCTLKESENSKLHLYEDIININNDINNIKNGKKLGVTYSEDSYYTNFSSDDNENNNHNIAKDSI